MENNSYYTIGKKKEYKFKDKSLEKYYNDNFNKIIKGLINDITIQMENAGDKHQVYIEQWKAHYDYKNAFKPEGKHHPLTIDGEARRFQGRDKNLSYEEGILMFMPDTTSKGLKEIIKNISTMDALFAFDVSDPTSVRAVYEDVLDEEINEDELSTKQKVLLLDRLGILNNVFLETLPNTAKAKLLSPLLDRNEQSVREALTYIKGGKDVPDEYNCRTPKNIKRVNDLLENSGVKELLIDIV